MTSHAQILPLYTRASPAPSTARRLAVLGGQLAIAAAYGFLAVALPPTLVVVLIAPVALCLLVVLWLMPDRGVFPLKAIERSTFVLLTLMIVWPSYLAVVLPGLPWLTPTRVALFVVSFFFLYSASISARLRHHLWTVVRMSPTLWVCLLIYEASMFYTVPFSHALTVTLNALGNNQLRLIELLFVGCLVYSRRGAPTRAVGWLVALSVVCAIDGFIESQLEYPPWANHIPSFLKVSDAVLANALGSQARSADGLYRVRGPFALSLVFAEYLAMCVPFIIHWLVTSRSLLVRLAMLVTWPAVLGAIFITHSRLGMVGFIVAHVLYLPMWALRRWRADRSALLGPLILFGVPVFALAALAIIFSSHRLTTMVLGGGAQTASNEARAQQRAMAVPRVLANPIGHGLGQSGTVLGFTNQAGYITVDNHFITSLIDVGIPGTIAFYTIFLVAARRGAGLYLNTKDRENELAGPLAVTLIVFVVIKTVLSQETNHPLVMLFVGMMLALLAREAGVADEGLFKADDGPPGATAVATPQLAYRAA